LLSSQTAAIDEEDADCRTRSGSDRMPDLKYDVDFIEGKAASTNVDCRIRSLPPPAIFGNVSMHDNKRGT
jgi:hypothetical protein